MRNNIYSNTVKQSPKLGNKENKKDSVLSCKDAEK